MVPGAEAMQTVKAPVALALVPQAIKTIGAKARRTTNFFFINNPFWAKAQSDYIPVRPACSGYRHATKCPLRTSLRTGFPFSEAQASLAKGHRVLKGHPLGAFSGLGISPLRTTRSFFRADFGSGTGIAERRDTVYGCIGSSKSFSLSASSTTWPRYMTAMRSDICLTTKRL